jgi:diguanylate cyclase (GGDEF)-like protein/putative nucleotidyltransferase with HDIG domain
MTGRSPLDAAIATRLRDAVARTERLPVLDRALARVLAVADREESTTGELVAAIEADPGLAASILRFANSAANVRVVPAKTVRQAVTMVGRRGVRRLALESVAYRFFERAAGAGPASLGRLHVHSVQVAQVAAETAALAGIAVDRAHLAGLLHDCGRLVMPAAFDPTVLEHLAISHPDAGSRARAEREVLGADHCHAGALLALASGVEPVVATAIAMHHGGDYGLVSGEPVAACVQVGDVLASIVTTGHGDEALLDEALGCLGLGEAALDRLAGVLLGDEAPLARLHDPETVDDLTGVASRRAWIRQARARLAAGELGSVVVCDLDELAGVNARHGRAMGDRVLAEVGELLRRHGLAGRLDDDEFAVWVPGGSEQGAEAAARIVSEVRDAFAPSLGLTASAGAVDASGTRLEAVIDEAHRALAAARAAAGGTHVVG